LSAGLIIRGCGEFLEHRIAEERIWRLIDQWLAAGVMEEGQWSACGVVHFSHTVGLKISPRLGSSI
jgi:hypothetical protein